MYYFLQAHAEPSQASEINLVARIVDVTKLTLLTIFVKRFITDV